MAGDVLQLVWSEGPILPDNLLELVAVEPLGATDDDDDDYSDTETDHEFSDDSQEQSRDDEEYEES